MNKTDSGPFGAPVQGSKVPKRSICGFSFLKTVAVALGIYFVIPSLDAQGIAAPQAIQDSKLELRTEGVMDLICPGA